MVQLDTEETQELLAVTASTNHHGSSSSKFEKSSLLAELQRQKTSTFSKKLWEFFKINLLGCRNEFEEYVIRHEASDCSLIAKYCETITVDLSKQDALSVDSVTLNTVHTSHPLVNFMKNEANQQLSSDDQVDVSRELHESPIIVFIHGLGGQMGQFEPLMGLLSQCLETLSLDLPGFGSSKLKFNDDYKIVSHISEEDKLKISGSIAQMKWEDFTTDNIVTIVYEFIQQQVPDNKKVVLVGHSMGTHISIKLAKKLPKHKVEGMILLSPPALLDDTSAEAVTPKSHGLLSMLKVFTYLPWLFNYFRTWDRLEGLTSASVVRQLSKTGNKIYNSLRQFRWNLDVNSEIVLRYINGFKKATTSELITAINNFNDNPDDKNVYEKTVFICGAEDQMTPISTIYKSDEFLTKTFDRKISAAIEVKNVGHSLLLVKPEFISGIILDHLELKFPERLHLSPAWVLKIKAVTSGDKWGLKNIAKWSQIQPVSSNITRRSGQDKAPLLGMKTLREGDVEHSPKILEERFYGPLSASNEVKGHLIAIVDISADIPPYSPKSFSHIKYYKCATVSKVVPDQSAIRRFIQLVNDILSENEVENPLIAVHCHYGFNRTGFLICCYLIEVLGWSVKEAVEGFKAAKPPGIKHPHFIDALYVRYEN
ncbi:Lipid droplet hydrolase 1 [Candida viswanathii]|uniref:Lipid droplet hydrolase 1 n=1 Tax=Candida viswanathii TaxID=5486 RepID=A0A367Y4I9_9ASCO|nr:Lipid droplet hydrolase 1 [Candida viswanathii]